MGWFFDRFRVALGALTIAIGYGIVSHFVGNIGARLPLQAILLNVTGICLILNLCLIGLQKERRIFFSLPNIIVLALLTIEVGGGFWLIKNFPEQLETMLLFPPKAELDLTSWTNLGIPMLLVAACSLLAMAFRLTRRFDHITMALFWTIAASVFAFDALGAQPRFAIFVTLGIIAVAIALLQTWYDIAYLDQLTGLPGRLALNEATKSLRSHYVMAMVDVDFFKKFNDTYGHDVGDQVLKLVASKLRQVSGGGLAFRYGGEEFTVVFPGKKVKEAFTHLSALRESIEETHMILRNKPRPAEKPIGAQQRRQPLRYLNVTVSIGIAENNEELTTPAAVIKAADEALYRAKERGRNRLSL
jgi:diguanylate cyclase (GGDEF)-like protein